MKARLVLAVSVLAIVLLAGLRERLQLANVPSIAQGGALTVILAGFLSLAFMGFAGAIEKAARLLIVAGGGGPLRGGQQHGQLRGRDFVDAHVFARKNVD